MRILYRNHVVSGDEYFRSKTIGTDKFYFLRWTSIRYLLGSVWNGRKLGEASFYTNYEFIEFEDDIERDLADILTTIKNERYIRTYMLWSDWGEHYVNSATKEQINYIVNTPINKCPHCKPGLIVEKIGRFGKFLACSNFPFCKFKEDNYDEDWQVYKEKQKQLIYLKDIISKVGLKNINMRLLKAEMRKEQ